MKTSIIHPAQQKKRRGKAKLHITFDADKRLYTIPMNNKVIFSVGEIPYWVQQTIASADSTRHGSL
jgi:hypothetical protein